MNADYFRMLADYTIWADTIVIEWLNQLNDDQWNQNITSSFSSIRQTALHIASAEKVWIDFWKCEPVPVFLAVDFNGTNKDLINIWREASKGMKKFIDECPEDNYLKDVIFSYPRGGEGKMQFWQTVSHIVNHSTYHRGQLVTLLRQIGLTNLSSIDLATYFILNQK
ncbi:DinB family protein [Flavobacterium sp. HTF]|uniref:DinB family protein n=1 Tax=Flavobacterium sp. HTF TaxID=2170732 RepID=UPI000D5D30F1|nr:DinB family protein [Flavobacterium sp. HTF]PWB23974.1 damage-inducible protein DinB [Flavobacterium sp. HTF]